MNLSKIPSFDPRDYKSKSSVYYWLADLFIPYHSEPSKSLCVYFWQVVGGFVAVTVMAILSILVSFFLTTPIWYYLFGFVALQEMASGVLVAYAIVAFILAISYGNYLWKKSREGVEPRPDGIAVAYLKAKKEKICPVIEFVD